MYFFTKDATCQNRLSDIHLAKNGGRAGSEELFMTCISHGAQNSWDITSIYDCE